MNSQEMIKTASEQPGYLVKLAANRMKKEIAKKLAVQSGLVAENAGAKQALRTLRATGTPQAAPVVAQEARGLFPHLGQSAGSAQLNKEYSVAMKNAQRAGYDLKAPTRQMGGITGQEMGAAQTRLNQMQPQIRRAKEQAIGEASKGWFGTTKKLNPAQQEAAWQSHLNSRGGVTGVGESNIKVGNPAGDLGGVQARAAGGDGAGTAAQMQAAAPGKTFGEHASNVWNQHIKPNWKPIAGGVAGGVALSALTSHNQQAQPRYGY